MIPISSSRTRDHRPCWLRKDVAGEGTNQNPSALDPKRASNELWGMAAIAFLVSYSNSMIAPLIPAFAREFGVHPVDFKWLVPGFSIIYGTATLFYGILSDRYGRYPLLKALLILASATVFANSLVHTSRQLVLFRCLSAASTGGIAAIALCIIGDRYPYIVQGRPMGGMFGAIATGIGFGSSLGPLLNPVLGWRNELRILSFAFGVAFLWIKRSGVGVLPRKAADPFLRYILEYRCILEAPRGGRTLGFIFANGAFHGGIFAWLGVLLASRYHLGEIGIGIVLAGYGLPDLFLGEVIGSWGDQYGRRRIVPIGFFWASICALVLAFESTPLISALTIAALSLGYGATHPLMSSITTSLDPKHRGQITGLATFANFLGVACGASLFRWLMVPHFSFALVCFGCGELSIGIFALHTFRSEGAVPRSSSSIGAAEKSLAS